MANFGGNNFPQKAAESYAERLPIWDEVNKKEYIGGVMLPDDTNPVGTFWPLGTPVELDIEGGTPKLGTDATKPNGLLLTDVTMAEGGCTFAIVTQGTIRASLMQATVTDAQKAALPLIQFSVEYVKQS